MWAEGRSAPWSWDSGQRLNSELKVDGSMPRSILLRYYEGKIANLHVSDTERCSVGSHTNARWPKALDDAFPH